MLSALRDRKIGIWLDRPLSRSKFLHGVARYARGYDFQVVVNTDPSNHRDPAYRELLSHLPMVESIRDAAPYAIDALLIGVCPLDADDAFPDYLLRAVEEALDLGLTIINPLHVTETVDPRLRHREGTAGRFINLRVYDKKIVFSGTTPRRPRILTVGNDCGVAKMTAAIQLTRVLEERGVHAGFFATGQTGILIAGAGVPLDHLEGDFMAGVIEHELARFEEAYDVVIIEGQGSILNPAYGGVSLALLQGARPSGVVLCEDSRRTHYKFLPDWPLPSIWDIWDIIPALVKEGARPRLMGVSSIGSDRTERRGVPAWDPFASPPEQVAGRIIDHISREEAGR
jgi:uncharacterized NAD-dependent epimerase/dehydratase family protein